MEFILNYWYIILATLVVAAVVAAKVYRFVGLPTEDQIANVREWLLYAVVQAEIELGSGTGQLKLRAVYDMFIQRFPAVSKLVPFSIFSDLVDDALVEMKNMIAQNEDAAAIIKG